MAGSTSRSIWTILERGERRYAGHDSWWFEVVGEDVRPVTNIVLLQSLETEYQLVLCRQYLRGLS